MKLRYSVACIVPDLIRNEPINIGIVVQSDDWVGCKFIERVPKSWDLGRDLTEDIAANLNKVWNERISGPPEIVYLPQLHRQEAVAHTDRTFLEWLNRVYTQHLTFSEIREAEIGIRDTFDYETFLERLYDMFVAPKPRPRKPITKSRLHTKIKKDLWQLSIPEDKAISEKDIVVGSFPWAVDFKYHLNGKNRPNGQEVAIVLVDLESVNYVEKAKDLLAVWVDVQQVQKDAVRRVSIVGGIAATEDHERAIKMLRPSFVSDDLYIYERDKEEFLTRVKSDLVSSLP